MTILVVGGGKMGMSHLAVVTKYVGKENVALVERKRSLRMLFGRLEYCTFSSLETAMEKGGVPAGIIIATPTPSHAPLAEWAIANKVPFFVEKPLTLDADRSAALLRASEAAGVPAQLGFVLRYIASFQKLRAIVAGGKLGPLQSYQATMRGNVITTPPTPDSWQGDFTRGGGCLNEYGPHLIDLCRFIFGPIESVGKVKMGHVHSTNADDWVALDWIHASTTSGRLDIHWSDVTKRKSVIDLQVQFETAELRVDNSAIEVKWLGGNPPDPILRAEIEAAPRPPNVGFYLRGEEFSLEMEDFLGTCMGRSFHVDPNLPDDITPRLKDGYEVDRLVDEIATKAGLK